MHNLFDLTGKKALVTGGSKGIGNRLARGLHDAGAEVVIFYNSTYSEQMAQEMQGDGPAVYAIQCNVADRSSLDTAVAQAAEKLGGRIDILINAAGINRRYWLEDFPLDMWDEVIATNLNGTVYCSQLVGQYMLRQGYGRIVNLASMNSFVAGPKMAAYVASKGAIAQVTKAFANEWGGRGIRVNAIAPAQTATKLIEGLMRDNPATRKYFEEHIPMGRLGKPCEIASAAVFLAADATSFVTGQTIAVDGGVTCAF